MKLSIIIPVWNEEDRIGKSLDKILAYMKKRRFEYEIIIVNDCSTDGTERVIRRYMKNNNRIRLVNNDFHVGKGKVVRLGMLAARYPIAMFTDSDLSTPIEEIDNFIKYIDKYDIVIGSRSIKGAKVRLHQSFFRELLGKTFNKIVRMLTVRGIVDTQCGFKMFKNCKRLFEKQRMMRWAFDVEILFLAQKAGKSIKELPVVWLNDKRSRLNPLSDSIDMLIEVIRVRINYMRGLYK